MMDALRKEVLVAYDAENNKERRKLYEALKDLGLKPIQKSVFWGHLNKAEEAACYRLFDTLSGKSDKAFMVRAKLGELIAEKSLGYRVSDFLPPESFDIL